MSLPADILWAQAWVLWLLPAPLLVFFALPARKPSSGRALRVPDGTPYLAWSRETGRVAGFSWLRLLLLCLTWLALLLAVARPQSVGEPVGVPLTGRDLMLCIDISGSMRETDLYAGQHRATRMAVVRQVASDFVARRTGDRIGLVMFGSQAYVQTPLTLDHQTVQHFLDEASVGLAGRSTAIGDAIGLAVKRLRERPESSRVIVLLTDGENSAGALDPLVAARLAADNQIRIHSIGVGADARSGGLAGPFSRNTELDEETLQAISEVTGGQYFRARNQQELARIYETIDELEPTDEELERFRPLRELFPWPLSAALLFSLLWAMLALPALRSRS